MEGVIKRPPRTLKERKFVKELSLTNGNATEAARRSYDVTSYGSAAQIGSELLKKLDIASVLDRIGVTDEKIASTVLEGMEANKPISAVAGRDASEASVDFIDVPDWPSRLKATELASKMKGHLKDRVDLTSGDIPFPIYGGKSKV